MTQAPKRLARGVQALSVDHDPTMTQAPKRLMAASGRKAE